jgi:hypothetical protein
MERTVGGRPGAFRCRDVRVPLSHQVTVPAQDRVWSHEQLRPAQYVAGQGMQERGEERPVRGRERHRARAEVALQYGELMAQSKDLDILVTVAHRQ